MLISVQDELTSAFIPTLLDTAAAKKLLSVRLESPWPARRPTRLPAEVYDFMDGRERERAGAVLQTVRIPDYPDRHSGNRESPQDN